LNVSVAPDRKAVVALHAGFNPHGLVVVDARSEEAAQRIPLKSAWLGLAWAPNGKRLYVSGGNANGKTPTRAPIYVFDYDNGRLSAKPSSTLEETIDTSELYWSGLVHHPSKPLLFAANRGTGAGPSNVVVFDTGTGKLMQRIAVEVNPYALVLSDNGQTLYVSNWASDSVSVIDVGTLRVIGRIPVGDNPNDMALSKDGRLFVSCSNDNSVVVVDTKTRQVIERISTALTPNSPEGSTPNALALDRDNQMLFVANADNNDVAVIRVAVRAKSEVLGFIPVGWYPSALAIHGGKLYVGNSKGMGSYSDIRGPHSPLPAGPEGNGSVKSLQKGSVEIVDLAQMKTNLRAWTKQVYDNTPYHDDQLVAAKASTTSTVIPHEVGAGSPIKHVLYILKENRTYDQVLGDLGKGNGDPRLTIFGEKVTPNHHALARQFVLLDNLFCDGEVSVDGHSWSNSAYATDFNEKLWPVTYGGHSKAGESAAYIPGAGHMWDLAQKKGLTYRSYGEYATRASTGTTMEASPGVGGLLGHVAPKFKLPGMRDTDNAAEFLREFDEFERNYDSPVATKRLPNFMVMSLPEDHTAGTTPGRNTPIAMVANNDYAVGMIVDRISHSRYWPETAIFIIEDDAQDGADHVDARRTTAYVVSPYIKRQTIDSTLYTTSSVLRTMELLLGLPPMSQYDAAASPMYASFSDSPDLTPFVHVKPQVDVNEKNTLRAYGARRSMKMDFRDVDEAPMAELNEILWKSIKGADSPVPAPVHRVRFSGRAAQ
ncbi:MAG TPA: alkaline phosphatase family protein, partial [Candidatus Acidoferrum sp.]|nr:alkaline phosphatase family protein [Candidatus Acidoferrum sp.]